jgi:hypothetical protein
MDSSKLSEILRKHAIWLDGSPEGERADLSGANLSGATLSFKFAQAYLAPWSVLVTPEYIEIGCQRHPIDRWLDWGRQDDPEEIHAMHSKARAWWNRHKSIVLVMAETVRLNESHPIDGEDK